MTEHDITKLPKWAQDKLRHAESRIEHLETRINEEIGVLPPTRIVLDPYINPRYLEERNIEFFPKSDDRIYVKLLDDGLDVQSPNGRLVVLPVSSNVVRLKAEGW